MRHTAILTGILCGLLIWQVTNLPHPLLTLMTGIVICVEILLLISDLRYAATREPVIKDGDE